MLNIGDTIAYTAKFLKSTGQFTGGAAQRRGTVLAFDSEISGKPQGYCRVRWHDADYVYLAEQYGEDYAQDAKDNGQLVLTANVCRVGSAKFAHNDL